MDGGSGALDLYMDPQAPSHFGGSLTLGAGLPGASASAGASDTVICDKGNLYSNLMRALAIKRSMLMNARMGL